VQDEQERLKRELADLESKAAFVRQRLCELNDDIVGPFGSRAKGKQDDIYTCRGCGLSSKNVECAGIYYCPNPLCTSSGAAPHRAKMKSFQEDKNGRHTVDPDEMLQVGLKFLHEHPPSDLTAAVRRMLPYWAKQGTWGAIEAWMEATGQTLPDHYESGWGPGPHPCTNGSEKGVEPLRYVHLTSACFSPSGDTP